MYKYRVWVNDQDIFGITTTVYDHVGFDTEGNEIIDIETESDVSLQLSDSPAVVRFSKPRGGNHGGGTTVQRVTLTEAAAAYVKRRATITGTRYRKQEADATASAIIEAAARSIYITDDMIAAMAYIQEARGMCFSEQAQRGLDQLIAALWTAAPTAAQKGKTMVAYTVHTLAAQEFDHDFNYVSVIDSHYEDDETILVLDVEVDESNAPRYEDELSADSAVVAYKLI